MNSFLKKSAALIAAGLMTAASLGAESFAESAQLTWHQADLKLEATVAKPTYTVKGAAGWRRIKLSTTTPGASIYYTKDGSKPTTKSKKSKGGYIKITKDTKIRAIAVLDGVSSAVMNKTFSVKTLYGDVTGDGKVNQNDYARLKNYLDGKTEYICKDNADCDGSGGRGSKDLTVLSQYLAGKITYLPSAPIVVAAKPEATITKIYGGKKVELRTSTSGANIYYTTNGSTPTTSSTLYTEPFTLSATSNVQAVAYLNGEYSNVRSFTTTVDKTSGVQADKSTSTTYDTEISVVLTCPTSASRIYYTTDGSDPKTSSTASLYSGAVKLTKDTTIKTYAQTKGYTDSDVNTFAYKVNAAFTISGTVWDDTPGSTITSNGLKASTEAGITGINVYLINSSLAVKDAATNYVMKTTTDANGNYSFSNIPKTATYKVVFEYNYQKYRAYNLIVSGGNQALAYTTVDSLKIKNTGAYTVNSYGTLDTQVNTVNKYTDAINSSYYRMFAVSNSTYSTSAENVSLALISRNYGALDLSIQASGYDTSAKTIQNGKKITYTVTLTNNSPMTITTLNDASVAVYISKGVSDLISNSVNTATLSTDIKFLNNGYTCYTFSNFINTSGMAPGKTASFSVEGYIEAEPRTVIECYAEVVSYRFSNNCYDYYSVPGNLTLGSVKEHDEAAAERITVVSSNTEKTLTTVTGSTTLAVGTTSSDILIVAKNCSNINEVWFLQMTNQTVATYTTKPQQIGDDLYIWFYVTGLKAGSSTIPVKYSNDTIYLSVKVNA